MFTIIKECPIYNHIKEWLYNLNTAKAGELTIGENTQCPVCGQIGCVLTFVSNQHKMFDIEMCEICFSRYLDIQEPATKLLRIIFNNYQKMKKERAKK